MYQNIIVTESCESIREIARNLLSGKWKIAVMAVAIYTLALAVPTAVIEIMLGDESKVLMISNLYCLLVVGAFTLGISVFFLKLVRKEEPLEVVLIFSGFERFFKTVGLMLVMMLFISLWSCLLIIPGIIAAYRYSMAFYIMADHPEYGIMECIRASKAITDGNKMKLFTLSLSFIGWCLLGMLISTIIVLPLIIIDLVAGSAVTGAVAGILAQIPFFWISAYMFTATTVMYEMMIGRLVVKREPLNVEPMNFSYDSVYDKDSEEKTVSDVKTIEEPVSAEITEDTEDKTDIVTEENENEQESPADDDSEK